MESLGYVPQSRDRYDRVIDEEQQQGPFPTATPISTATPPATGPLPTPTASWEFLPEYMQTEHREFEQLEENVDFYTIKNMPENVEKAFEHVMNQLIQEGRIAEGTDYDKLYESAQRNYYMLPIVEGAENLQKIGQAFGLKDLNSNGNYEYEEVRNQMLCMPSWRNNVYSQNGRGVEENVFEVGSGYIRCLENPKASNINDDKSILTYIYEDTNSELNNESLLMLFSTSLVLHTYATDDIFDARAETWQGEIINDYVTNSETAQQLNSFIINCLCSFWLFTVPSILLWQYFSSNNNDDPPKPPKPPKVNGFMEFLKKLLGGPKPSF